MSLKTSTAQAELPLRAYYEALAHRQLAQPSFREAAQRMLKLLPRLEDLCKDLDVWGLVSAGNLLLQNRDDYRARVFVYISTWERASGYVVSYPMPEETAPWPGARVRGYTEDLDQALMMIEKALHASGGW